MREKIQELIPLLERFKQDFTAAASDGDQGEKQRRSELSRCVRRSPNTLRWKISRSNRRHYWERALQLGSWIRAKIPKQWLYSSNDFERLLPTTK